MVKFFTENIQNLINAKRFNPKYFDFINYLHKLKNNSKYEFKLLGDKSYFPILSDGIHSEVSLETSGTVKYLYTHSLKNGFIDITDNIFLNLIDHSKNISKKITNNRVLISVVGTLGNVAMFSDYIPYECNLPRNIAYVDTNETNILPEYLTCYFLSDFGIKQCVYSGGGNVQGLISLTKLKKFEILIPDMETQAYYRKSYRKALSLQKEFLKKIEYCKHLFYKSLHIDTANIKKDISFEVSQKDLFLNSISTPQFYNPYSNKILNYLKDNFEIVELGKIGDFQKGNEISSENYFDYLNRPTESVPFIRTSDIYNHEIDSFPSIYADKNIFDNLHQDFKENDLIISNDGKIGYCSIITKEDTAIFQSHIKRYRVHKNTKHITNQYVFLCLLIHEIGRSQFNKYTVVQSTIPTLSNRINKVNIPIINYNDMDTISDEVSQAFSLLSQKKQIIKQIKSEISKLFQ